jgi:hypothetical protein
MAIRRCPYCKAIIDESQKYCNNCGTQLLFPEDESLEEDVKGEKIVDEDFKDADDDESLDESSDAPDGEAASQVIDLEEVFEVGTGFPDELGAMRDGDDEDADVADEDLDEDPVGVEEKVSSPPLSKRGRPNKVGPAAPPPPPSVPTKAPTRRPTTALKPPTQSFALPPLPPLEHSAPAAPLSVVEPPPFPPARPEKQDGRSFILDAFGERDKEPPSREVESVPGYGPGSLAEPETGLEEPESAEDRGEETDTKEEIARLISALEKKHQQSRAPGTASKIIAPLDAADDLPPWSDMSHDTSAEEAAETGPEPDEKAEVSSYVPGDTMDFQDEVMRRADAAAPKPTIGMPEAPVKPRTDIIFPGYEDPAPPAEEPAAEPIIRRKTRDFEVESEDEPPRRDETRLPPRGRLGLFRRIAATVFDLVFVAIFWAAAVGLGAMLMDTEAVGLVRATFLPLALLYGVLLAGYLFLFFFFLGETLGGRLVSPPETA